MKKKIIILSLIATALFPNTKQLTIPMINNEIAFKLFEKLDKDKNLFFSPFSIYMAVSMAYLGAQKETKQEFEKVLKLNEENVKEFKEIMEITQSTEKNTGFRIANKIWPAITAKIKKDFSSKLEKIFKIDVEQVDYSQPKQAADIINSWTSNQTNGKIKEIISPKILNPLIRLVITNAVYFYNEWEKKFDEKKTHEDFFYAYKKEKQKVKFMLKEEKIHFYSDKNVKIGKIPYKDYKMSLWIIMPENIESFSIDYKKIQEYMNKTDIMNVEIHLPKFKMEYFNEMSDVFKSIGLVSPFMENKADFTGIMDEPTLHIKYILHKAFIEVSEKGTEAAAATAVVMGIKSAPIDFEKKVFKVDKPFIFFIVNEATNTIIFLGRLMEI